VTGGRSATSDTQIDELSAFRHAIRPGDRHEPWSLATTPALRRLAEQAGLAGLDFEIAVRLVIETALATGALRDVGVESEELDDAAAAASVERTLDGATSAYLRRLTRRPRESAPALGEMVTVGLPVRLSPRLLDADPQRLVETVEVRRARAWEIAALAAGQTISEWAAWTAVRLVTAKGR
jgi:hypothetical protein